MAGSPEISKEPIFSVEPVIARTTKLRSSLARSRRKPNYNADGQKYPEQPGDASMNDWRGVLAVSALLAASPPTASAQEESGIHYKTEEPEHGQPSGPHDSPPALGGLYAIVTYWTYPAFVDG